MALTNSEKNLIRALADNDIKQAKQWAIICCNEDNTQKNSDFVKEYKRVLENPRIIELPSNIKGFVCAEDVSETFNEKRYYLSERERLLSDKIMRMAQVGNKLKKMKIPYRNSTLLFGDSGTGKTTFGRYIAHISQLPFCYLKFSSLIDSYMGMTAKNIEKAFSFVLSTPCVFMLDELDSIGINRAASSYSGSDGEASRITITLMQELDKLPNDVILLAATNRIDRIDSALLRRFSEKHEVKPLNDEEKEKLISTFLSDVGIDFSKSVIKDVIYSNSNQAQIINSIIEKIAEERSDNIDNERSNQNDT